MRNSKIKLLQTAAVFLLSMFLMSHLTAEEIIIQQEEISFEKCLEVIAISENKLSIAPKIKDIPEQKRIALFTLTDGKLTITCDNTEGKITVATSTD